MGGFEVGGGTELGNVAGDLWMLRVALRSSFLVLGVGRSA